MTTKNKSEAAVPAWANSPAVPPAAGASPSLSNPFDVTHTPAEQAQVAEPAFNDDAFRQMMQSSNLGSKAKSNPFAAKKAVPVAEPVTQEINRREGTPAWSQFALFICKHGQVITKARYPFPMGECVDTMWRGVPVTHWETAEVFHKTEGWIDWETAQSTEES